VTTLGSGPAGRARGVVIHSQKEVDASAGSSAASTLKLLDYGIHPRRPSGTAPQTFRPRGKVSLR